MIDFRLGRAKGAAERFRISVNFANLLEQGDTVSSGTATAKEFDQRDMADAPVDATSTVVGTVSVSSPSVRAVVQAGTAGKSYLLTVSAVTAQGDTFVRTIAFDVIG